MGVCCVCGVFVGVLRVCVSVCVGCVCVCVCVCGAVRSKQEPKHVGII